MPRISDNSQVLDAGSGILEEQHFRKEILSTGAQLTTCDLHGGEGVDVVASLEKLPFESETFHIVLLTQVLEHAARPEEILKELNRILKPDGSLFVTAPQSCHLLFHDDPPHLFNYTRHGLEMLLLHAGFEIDASKPQGGHFLNLGQQLHYTVRVLRDVSNRGGANALVIPLIPLAQLSFGFFSKLICLLLDDFDKECRNTLGWCCHATKTTSRI